MTSSLTRAPRGFTLIELVVAIAITALIAAMGYGTMTQALGARDTIKHQQARLLELETTMRVLEQDFVQLTPRPVRQAVGDEPSQPSLQAGPPGQQPLLALTRSGWTNPQGLQRSELQRVAYFLENGTLRREYWFVLDPTLSSTTGKRDLLSHVKSVSFQFMDLTHTWQTLWPPATVAGAQALESGLRIRPIAVQVTIDTEDFGQVVRIFEVAG